MDCNDLFDHLVGALLQKPRYLQPERLSGLEIDRQYEFGRQLNGKLARGFFRHRPQGLRCTATRAHIWQDPAYVRFGSTCFNGVSSRPPYHIAADDARIAASARGLVDDRTLAHDDDPIGELKDLVEIL